MEISTCEAAGVATMIASASDLVDQAQRIGRDLYPAKRGAYRLEGGGIRIRHPGYGDVRSPREPREMLRAKGAQAGDQDANRKR